MRVEDVDNFNLGEILDIITTFNNISDANESKNKTRNATQSDFDRF